MSALSLIELNAFLIERIILLQTKPVHNECICVAGFIVQVGVSQALIWTSCLVSIPKYNADPLERIYALFSNDTFLQVCFETGCWKKGTVARVVMSWVYISW